MDDSIVYYVSKGPIYLGAILTQGLAYFLGTNGDIVPEADLGSGDVTVYLGIAINTTELDLDIQDPGIAKP